MKVRDMISSLKWCTKCLTHVTATTTKPYQERYSCRDNSKSFLSKRIKHHLQRNFVGFNKTNRLETEEGSTKGVKTRCNKYLLHEKQVTTKENHSILHGLAVNNCYMVIITKILQDINQNWHWYCLLHCHSTSDCQFKSQLLCLLLRLGRQQRRAHVFGSITYTGDKDGVPDSWL